MIRVFLIAAHSGRLGRAHGTGNQGQVAEEMLEFIVGTFDKAFGVDLERHLAEHLGQAFGTHLQQLCRPDH